MSRKTVKILQIVVLLIAIILMRTFSESAVAAIIIALIGISIWFNYLLRCPHCGEYLGD